MELLNTGVHHANISLGRGLAWLLGLKNERHILSIEKRPLGKRVRKAHECIYCYNILNIHDGVIKIKAKTDRGKYFTNYACGNCWKYIPAYLEHVGKHLAGEEEGHIDEFMDFLYSQKELEAMMDELEKQKLETREKELYPEDLQAY